MTVSRYKVQFRTEPGFSDEAHDALAGAGFELVSAHGGVSHSSPGGELPEVSTHYTWVDADGEDAAGRTLTEALEEKTVAFELLGVEPLPVGRAKIAHQRGEEARWRTAFATR